jgi:hypothetical protein
VGPGDVVLQAPAGRATARAAGSPAASADGAPNLQIYGVRLAAGVRPAIPLLPLPPAGAGAGAGEDDDADDADDAGEAESDQSWSRASCASAPCHRVDTGMAGRSLRAGG